MATFGNFLNMVRRGDVGHLNQEKNNERKTSGMLFRKRNALFGRYPSCDMLNNALRFLFDDEDISKNELHAASEIIFAIQKANGYFHEDLKEKIDFIINWRIKSWCK